MATRSGRSTTIYSKRTCGIIWAVLVNIAVISVHMEGLLSSSSLPSADFSITADSSGEEEVRRERESLGYTVRERERIHTYLTPC